MIGDRDRQLVLGLGGTVDFELRWDAAVVERLAYEHRISRHELSPDSPITDERSLLVALLAFVAAGTGAERFVASSDVVEGFASRFGYEVTLGGTGVRAGLVLERLGIPSVQHLVSIDDNVRRLLPRAITVLSSATRDTLDPHLIVQYPAGAGIGLIDGDILSPSANRLIFANDPPNREMALAPGLADALATASAFLISGFNTMQDHALLEQRLGEILVAMRRLPEDALVYYEDAGFYRRAFAETVRARLLPHIDVYGMNEDELEEYAGRRVDLLDAADVLRAIHDVRTVIPVPALVVHTRHWALAAGPDAPHHHAALESAVRVAATRYRLGDALTASDVDATADLPRDPRGAALVDAVLASTPDAAGVPAFLLDVASPTTIGLGDSFVGGFLAAHEQSGDPR